MIARSKYPNHYKNITFIFNDVDTMPAENIFFDYTTTTGIIKHFYGYNFALGGIVSITGEDFENVNGFPCYWAWGFEDNRLNRRVLDAGMKIDRSHFYPIYDKENIIQLKHGMERTVNRGEFDRYVLNVEEGISTLTNIGFQIEPTGFIHIQSFHTVHKENKQLEKSYDIRSTQKPFIPRPSTLRQRNIRMKLVL